MPCAVRIEEAISLTVDCRGGFPCDARSSMYLTIASSSVRVKVFELGIVSCREAVLLSLRLSELREMLYAFAAAVTFRNWPDLKANTARSICPCL